MERSRLRRLFGAPAAMEMSDDFTLPLVFVTVPTVASDDAALHLLTKKRLGNVEHYFMMTFSYIGCFS